MSIVKTVVISSVVVLSGITALGIVGAVAAGSGSVALDPKSSVAKAGDRGQEDLSTPAPAEKTTKFSPEALIKCMNSPLVSEAFVTEGWGHASIEIVTTITDSAYANYEANRKKGDLLVRQAKRCITSGGSVYVEFQYADGGILINDNF